MSYAQIDSTDTAVQSWADFNASYTFNSQWIAYGDAGYRIIFGNRHYHRLYIRPSGSFQMDKIFVLHAGISLFTTFNEEGTLWEFRPFQGLEIRWPRIFFIPLTHYIRMEERFFNENRVSTFILRGRYQLNTRIRFSETKIEKYFYMPLQLELFVNLGKDIDFHANEFRAVAGLGYVIDLFWRIEFNAIYENLRTSAEEQFTLNDIILRLRVYKEFNPFFDL